MVDTAAKRNQFTDIEELVFLEVLSSRVSAVPSSSGPGAKATRAAVMLCRAFTSMPLTSSIKHQSKIFTVFLFMFVPVRMRIPGTSDEI